jgi:hypothetical protein
MMAGSSRVPSADQGSTRDFDSESERTVYKDFDIREYTDPEQDPMVRTSRDAGSVPVMALPRRRRAGSG